MSALEQVPVFKTLLIILYLCSLTNAFSCKNENNESVDWYVLYKLPRSNNGINPLLKQGVSYLYITSAEIENGWKISNTSISNSHSMPGYTLQPFYENSTWMHILYNDETPSGAKNNNLGHTKGALISNDTNGFWLIHSVPHYPPEDAYFYPKTGLRYGQSFLCISMNLQNINNVGKQLQYNQPLIYKRKISKLLEMKLPNIFAVINNHTVQAAPWCRSTQLSSQQGTKFVSFAKSKQFGKDIYEDWVASFLENNLMVESWLNGPGRMPSNCSRMFKVFNIKTIELPSANFSFSSSKDHSKWAITKSKTNSSNWICVGDINREEHQKLRGGGTVCLAIQKLWEQYKNIVVDIEQCTR